jgi:hypothetical protein
MSATVTNRSYGLDDHRRTVTADVTVDGYTPGGVAVSLDDLGLTQVQSAWVDATPTETAVVVQVDTTDPFEPVVTAQIQAFELVDPEDPELGLTAVVYEYDDEMGIGPFSARIKFIGV